MKKNKSYFEKWISDKKCTLTVPSIGSLIWTFIAAFLGILIVSYIGYETEYFPLFAPFGASAVLLYGAPAAPFSQPRSLIGGHLIAAVVGVITVNLFGANFIAVAFSVALTIVLTLIAKAVHPPAGATAFLAVTSSGGEFMWIFKPVLFGAFILLLVALVINNIDKDKSYPDYWI